MLSLRRFKFDVMSRWVVVLLLSMCCMQGCRSSRFNEYSCNSLRPIGGYTPQNQPNPFVATAVPQVYTSGTPVSITINSVDGQTFTGLLLQARYSESTTPVGSWNLMDSNGYTTLDCGGDEDATLIDLGPDQNRMLPQTFVWNPPNGNVRRTINLYIDIEVRKGVFWWFTLTIPPSTVIPLGCDLNPCQNDGTCNTDEDGEIFCYCNPPFTGPLCTDCIRTDCDDRQNCPGDASFCVPNSCTGSYCSRAERTECVACDHNPCFNGGTCMHDLNLPQSFRCECPPGFTGSHCDTLASTQLPTPPVTYQLTPLDENLLNSGNITYLLFTPGGVSEILPNVQGYEYTYGLGMPNRNPRRATVPLIVDADDTIWLCLRRTDAFPSFSLDIRSLSLFSVQVPADRPTNFELPFGILNAFTSEGLDCFTSDPVVADTRVEVDNIQGLTYSHGTGMPIQNRQMPNRPLFVLAGDTFWFCLDPIPQPFPRPPSMFSLNLFAA